MLSESLTQNSINCIKSKSKLINDGSKFKWKNFLSGKVEFLKPGIWFQFTLHQTKIHFLTHPVNLDINMFIVKPCSTCEAYFQYLWGISVNTCQVYLQHWWGYGIHVRGISFKQRSLISKHWYWFSARQCYQCDEEAALHQIIYSSTSHCIYLQSTAQNLLRYVSHLQQPSSKKSIRYYPKHFFQKINFVHKIFTS